MTGQRALDAALAGRRSLLGAPPHFDPATVPEDPGVLFRAWFVEAVDAGVAEPHVMTLSTVDADGAPDARVLILKAQNGTGFAFAGPARSATGAQLAAVPAAALTFWWQPMTRWVRVRGTVAEADEAESRADFLARTPSAQALVADGAAGWRRRWLRADRIEFAQGSRDRRHVRLEYRLDGGSWSHARIRP